MGSSEGGDGSVISGGESWGFSGGRGAVRGPSQPSWRPRMYSFQVLRPRIRSPCVPFHSEMPWFFLASRMGSTSSSVSLSVGGVSPFRRRCFLILSARPALTSPCLRPSITSQSTAPATRIGFMYSWKCSRAGRRLSPGGAESRIVIFRGIVLFCKGSSAMWATYWHHFCWARFLWYRS